MAWGPTAPTFSGAWIESQHLKSLLDLLIQNFPHKILRWFSVQEALLRLTLDFIRCYLLPETLPESFYKVFFPGVLTSACACLSHSILVFSCSVASSSLWPHEQQHARLPCPSLSPRVCTNSYLLSRWFHPTILSSVTSLSCPQSFPESGSFTMSLFFASGGQTTRDSASLLPIFRVDFLCDWLVLTPPCPMNSQESSPASHF